MSAVLTETHRPAVVERTPEQCRIAGIVAEFSDSEIDVIREALQFLGPRTLGVDRSICEDLVTEIGPRAPATTKVPS